MLQQHSQHLDLRIDCDKVLGAITFMQSGKRLSLGPWSNCPGWRPKNSETPAEGFPEYRGRELIEQDGVRVAGWKRWIDYATKTAQHIPRAVTKRQVPPQHKTIQNLPEANDTEQSRLTDYYNDHCEHLLIVPKFH
jgi:hypothetical protein